MPRTRDDFANFQPLGPHWIGGDEWEAKTEWGWYGWVWPSTSSGERIALWDIALPAGARASILTHTWVYGGGGVVLCSDEGMTSYYLLSCRSLGPPIPTQYNPYRPAIPARFKLALEKVTGAGTSELWAAETYIHPAGQTQYFTWTEQVLGLSIRGNRIALSYLAEWVTDGDNREVITVTVTDSSPLSGRLAGMYGRVATPNTAKVGGNIDWFQIQTRGSNTVHRVTSVANSTCFPATTHEATNDNPVRENDYGALIVKSGILYSVYDSKTLFIGRLPQPDDWGAFDFNDPSIDWSE